MSNIAKKVKDKIVDVKDKAVGSEIKRNKLVTLVQQKVIQPENMKQMNQCRQPR